MAKSILRDQPAKCAMRKVALIAQLRKVTRNMVPPSARAWLRRKLAGPPLVGSVKFGSLRRVRPISPHFGLSRGRPIDRYYIENFLADHSEDVHGRVLEIGWDKYTRRYGGGRVTQSDVLHVEEGHPGATIIADLTRSDHIFSDAFDCAIVTQTLQQIYDVRAAIRTIFRILRPGGVLLATVPGISQIDRYAMSRWGDYWRFTTLSAYRLFTEIFPVDTVTVRAWGNVLVGVAFLHGLSADELLRHELDARDPDYELVIAIRAVKPGGDDG